MPPASNPDAHWLCDALGSQRLRGWGNTLSMRLIIYADWFCSLKMKRQPIKKIYNYFHQSQWPWSISNQFIPRCLAVKAVPTITSRVLPHFTRILQEQWIFLWSRRFTHCGQVPDVPKRLHLQRKSENLEVYRVYSPSLSRKAPMTNKLTEYFIKDRYG